MFITSQAVQENKTAFAYILIDTTALKNQHILYIFHWSCDNPANNNPSIDQLKILWAAT